MPDGPISPPPAKGHDRFELPAYVSNGLIGLRIPDIPLLDGRAMVSGFSGEHPEKRTEAAARAPFPLGGDIAINGVALSHTAHCVSFGEQWYDFACGELTTRFTFTVAGVRAAVQVLIFCSRTEPTIACQQIDVTVDRSCHLAVSGGILTAGVGGEADYLQKEVSGRQRPVDGAVRWSSPGRMSTCGLAYVTALASPSGSHRGLDANSAVLKTTHSMKAEPRDRIRLRQMTSVVPGALHRQPELQAARLVAMNDEVGFDAIRAANRAEWENLWKSRIMLIGAERRWQAMADAAFFYLNTSVHPSAPGSTSMFGLATWPNYHYYYGHVMWDVEAFLVPVLTLVQPHAAAALLEYRFRSCDGAHRNARMNGLRGLQFPWESGPSTGDEAAPLPGGATWHEDHVTLDVALAFAFHAHVTGDGEFLKSRAWPVLSGVATWIVSRALRTSRGYEIRRTMGIAEGETPVDNAAFTNVSAKLVLKAALETGATLGEKTEPIWRDIADNLVLPTRDDALVSYDGFRDDGEKSATPDPLMALFPLGFPLTASSERATLALYLAKANDYLGNPMLSALCGVWAAWSGDRALASDLLDQGYAAFVTERFTQTLEYRSDRFPEQPMAGPFVANIGGFLQSLLLGFPAVLPNAGVPADWCCRPVILPEGWTAIEVERLWIRGRPTRLTARHGDSQASLEAQAEGPDRDA